MQPANGGILRAGEPNANLAVDLSTMLLWLDWDKQREAHARLRDNSRAATATPTLSSPCP